MTDTTITTALDLQTLDVQAADGHAWQVYAVVPKQPQSRLLWLPALGVAARHYLPFAQCLAASGVAVFLHDWRGNGTSNLRPSHACDWGYRELLELDLPATQAVIDRRVEGVPRLLGGHSLGGQLACCHLARAPDAAATLWLVASGAPYWRAFPAPTRWWLPLAYRFLPWLADRCGYLPGHSIGFGGRESRSLIRDWARTALSGVYRPRDVEVDIEAAMARLDPDVHAIVMSDDWLAPPGSTRFLLDKLRARVRQVDRIDAQALGTRADHFGWMKAPDAVVRCLVGTKPD